MVMSLQESALRFLQQNPEGFRKALAEFPVEDSQKKLSGIAEERREESSNIHPIASVARNVLREVYPELPLDARVDSVMQFLTTQERIQELNRASPWPVNRNRSLASIYVEIRFQKLLRFLKQKIERMRGGAEISKEEFAAFFDCAAFRHSDTRKHFLQQAIQILDLSQFTLEEHKRMPGVQRLLFLSSKSNYWEGVQELADQAISLNFQAASGQTALHYAARENSLESMRILIERGAELNIQDNEGETPLHRAMAFDREDAIGMLITEDVDLNIQDDQDASPLYCTAENDALETIEVLIGAGADPNIQNDHGSSPLHIAVHANCLKIILALIKGGADLNIQDDQGRTPLHYAAQYNNLEILRILIAAGAKLNIQDEDDRTPISHAKAYGAQEAVQMLVNAIYCYGADNSSKKLW